MGRNFSMIHSKHSALKLHFVGIGGIGMSGIAEVFINQGYHVSGSDLVASDTTRRLESMGAKIIYSHAAVNVRFASVVVISSAVRPDNVEVLAAHAARIPVIPRAEMLGELMRGKTGIAVAGSHGKTTTTSMLATILTAAGLDPTIIVGGVVNALGSNAKLGRGELVVAEADESDGSFLHLPATHAVVTNIDDDHLDYFGGMEALERAFIDFVGKIPFYGKAAVCIDDFGLRRCLERFTKPIMTYGFSSEAEVQAVGSVLEPRGSKFAVVRNSTNGIQELGEIQLLVPGKHNILNALAAVCIAIELGITVPVICEALRSFSGVQRRFEIRWQDEKRRRAIIEDYGHHPTEIKATLEVARRFWPGRILAVFQPHRYTRTKLCASGFSSAFGNCDILYLTEIYAASEDPIPGVNSELIATAMLQEGKGPSAGVKVVGGLDSALESVISEIRDGDLVICLGAGSISQLPGRLIERLDRVV